MSKACAPSKHALLAAFAIIAFAEGVHSVSEEKASNDGGFEARKAREEKVRDFLEKENAEAEARAKEESIRLVNKSWQEYGASSQHTGMPIVLPQAAMGLGHSPSNVVRDTTTYDWCKCHTGLQSVNVWPSNDRSKSFTISADSTRWVQWDLAVDEVSWSCDGMTSISSTSVNLASKQWLSLLVYLEPKDGPLQWLCQKPTGRLHWNKWTNTGYTSSIPFTTHTEGYACFKIPALLWTAAGTLIAFSEARTPECSDYSSTRLAYKRSFDGGATWSALSLLVNITPQEESSLGLCGHPLVIGNVAPVQLGNHSKYPGRILAPHNRNNFATWLTYSDDDGRTWSSPVELQNVSYTEDQPDCQRDMNYFGFDIDHIKLDKVGDFVKFAGLLCSDAHDPFTNSSWTDKLSGPWQWVGVGPPGGLQLKSGRVLIPAYHGYIRGLDGKGVLPLSQLYNNFAKGHVLISDDFGDSWRLGSDWPIGQGADEHQLVLLSNGSVLSNSRSLSTGSPQWRVQARSDDGGETFTPTQKTKIPEPFNGCQGSAVGASNPGAFSGSNMVYVANPDPAKSDSILQKAVDMLGCTLSLNGRNRVSLWRSSDGGTSFPEKFLIDPGLSAQTSLQYHDGKLMLLYEQADPGPLNPGSATIKALLQDLTVLLPTRLVLQEVQLPQSYQFV